MFVVRNNGLFSEVAIILHYTKMSTFQDYDPYSLTLKGYGHIGHKVYYECLCQDIHSLMHNQAKPEFRLLLTHNLKALK